MYHSHALNLSDTQLRQMAMGHAVRIKHSHLHGNRTILMTKTQLERIHKAHAQGRGIQIRLSKAALSHNMKQGGSIVPNGY